MKLNRKWMLIVALVMSMVVATGGTLAYLTDRDSAANVFTLGNVQIKLNEEFDDGAELIPGVNIVKKPTITNTGKNDAWVWATIAIPTALDTVGDASSNVVHFNMSAESIAEGLWNWKEGGKYIVAATEIEGVEYTVYTALYETVLKPGDTTAQPVIHKVYMDPHVDIDPNGDLYHVENGVAKKYEWNINTDGNPIIYVSAYAIQAEGFDTVQDAYAAYNAQWGNNGTEYADPLPADAVLVSSADELTEALKAGKNVVLMADITLDEAASFDKDVSINLNNHTLATSGLTFTADVAIKDGTVKSNGNTSMQPHLNVTGGKLTLDSVSVEIESYLNYYAQGNRAYAEFVGVGVVNGEAVLNNSTVTVTNDTHYTWSYLYALALENSTVTMNGGQIVAQSKDSTLANDYVVAVSGMGNCTANLNNVEIETDSLGLTMGHLIINTTDEDYTVADIRSLSGGTSEVNHIN